MLESITLDQFRTFIAAVDEGSFSAAGRKLGRAQSVVSQTIANLENQINLTLFDRAGRYPKLTDEGRVLLSDARDVLEKMDSFRARAKGMSAGLEPELSVAIDVMFPIAAVTQAATKFAAQFPGLPFLLHVQALGAVSEQVLDGVCSLGIIGSLPDTHDRMRVERLIAMQMVVVAAPNHPLAQLQRPLRQQDLAAHTQIILTDQTGRSGKRTFGVVSRNVWRLTDLGAKREFLLGGLGWGGMPISAVENDISLGALEVLTMEDEPLGGIVVPMSVVYLASSPPGPAGRWFIDTLRECARQHEVPLLGGPA